MNSATQKRNPAGWEENTLVWFPTWSETLEKAPLSVADKAAYRRAILGLLKHCKALRCGASIGVAKAYLGPPGAQDHPDPAVRDGLRWFFREARRRATTASPSPGGSVVPHRVEDHVPDKNLPRPAAQDLGTTEWEATLIRELRARGLLWRTEQTYRAWSWRFAAFLRPRNPRLACGPDVKAFCDELAVRGRVAAATQRQALNALVFLMQEALRIDLGDITGFKRAEAPGRVPTVLTRDECRRLFASLAGTSRLMAQLAYGSGLRLMELLRLRVQDLDLERLRVTVRAGKGNKDRMAPLPQALVRRLQEHAERCDPSMRLTGLQGCRAFGCPRDSRGNTLAPARSGLGNGFSLHGS